MTMSIVAVRVAIIIIVVVVTLMMTAAIIARQLKQAGLRLGGRSRRQHPQTGGFGVRGGQQAEKAGDEKGGKQKKTLFHITGLSFIENAQEVNCRITRRI